MLHHHYTVQFTIACIFKAGFMSLCFYLNLFVIIIDLMNLSRNRVALCVGLTSGFLFWKQHSQNAFFSSSNMKEQIYTYLWGNGYY